MSCIFYFLFTGTQLKTTNRHNHGPQQILSGNYPSHVTRNKLYNTVMYGSFVDFYSDFLEMNNSCGRTLVRAGNGLSQCLA